MHTHCFPAGGWQPSTSVPVCLEKGKGLRLPASPPPDMAVATALSFPSHLHVANSNHPSSLTKKTITSHLHQEIHALFLLLLFNLLAHRCPYSVSPAEWCSLPYSWVFREPEGTTNSPWESTHTYCWVQFSATDAAGKSASRVPQRDG